MCISYQIEELIEFANYQFRLKGGVIDFLVQKYKCFVEFHQIIRFPNVIETIEEYEDARRKLLNKNGYNDYNLVVIQ